MKSFRAVEATRLGYHRDDTLDSVHRSSLIVPELGDCDAEISFVNHWLLKRGYANIACRITAVDLEGDKIEARLFPITEPRVYTFPLTGSVSKPVANYLVDFFTSSNFFIPYPAVIVNHRSPRFHSMVHAYNRILNDVFEDDSINAVLGREASVDVCLDPGMDTFAVFTAGPQRCQDQIDVELATEHGTYRTSVPVDVPRFCNASVSLRTALPHVPDGEVGVLKIRQPRQFLFFGRMLAGQRRSDGAFSANHSYYDCSEAPEYWEDTEASERLYPFFDGIENIVRIYPIMSPGCLAFAVTFYGRNGRALGTAPVGELRSPSSRFIECSVNRALATRGLEAADVASFLLSARPVEGKTPTRITHQLVYGLGQLRASVNTSLFNPHVFTPTDKNALTWGQLPVGGSVRSWLGVVSRPQDPGSEVEIVFYGADGEIARRTRRLVGGDSIRIDVEDELRREIGRLAERPAYLWYWARSSGPMLQAFVLTRHTLGDQFTAEHSF